MSETYVLLLEQVTIFSSVTALILIAVKQLFKCRIPPRIGMALWIVLLARLLQNNIHPTGLNPSYLPTLSADPRSTHGLPYSPRK